MVTVQNLKEVFNKLISDENFCRLLAYGDNPFDDRPNITDRSDLKDYMRTMIKFSPQIEDLATNEMVRVLMFKSYAKLGTGAYSVIRDTSIEINLFVPNRLVQQDFRVYTLEEKICSLLDGIQITGIGILEYATGQFTISPVNGYSFYRMIFYTREGRNPYGKR